MFGKVKYIEMGNFQDLFGCGCSFADKNNSKVDFIISILKNFYSVLKIYFTVC